MTGETLTLLAEASWRSMIVAGGVAVALAARRTPPGALRHAAWASVMFTMATLPLLARLAMPVHVPTPVPLRALEHAMGEAMEGGIDAPLPGATLSVSAPDDAVGAAAPMSAALAVSAADVVMILYGFGVVVLFLRLAAGLYATRRLTRSAVPLPASGEIPSVPLHESPLLSAPVTLGLLWPRILMPAGWRAWPADRQRAALLHELAHRRRRDGLVLFAAQLNRCLFWFHPLAWWLERALARHAEHACDAAVVRDTGAPRRYADVLVEMAEAVRRGGHRVDWGAALGIGGRGLLAQRIERVLRLDAGRSPSHARAVAVALCCAAAVILGAACRPDRTPIALRDDPQEQETRAQAEARRAFETASREMSPADAEALEAKLHIQPEDMDTRHRLLLFYGEQLARSRSSRPLKAPDPRSIAGRRRHALWVIEHRPASELAGTLDVRLPAGTERVRYVPRVHWAQLVPDPQGHAQARQMWRTHVTTAAANPTVTGNAAAFVEDADPAAAEELLRRAKEQDPSGPWSRRLGRLYATAVTSLVQRDGTVRPLDASDTFIEHAREELRKSEDVEMLVAAAQGGAWRGHGSMDERRAHHAQAVAILDRALLIAPLSVEVRAERLRLNEQTHRARFAFHDVAPVDKYDAVAALPEADRFLILADLALDAYRDAEDSDRLADGVPDRYTELALTRARRFAEDLLTLAPAYRAHPRYGTALYKAHLTLGLLALRAGDRREARRHLLAAAEAPASEELVYARPLPTGGLPHRLLKAGETEAVLAFLERMARTNVADRTRLREAAESIRRGRRPRMG